jgi:hypothetical protein
MAKEKSTNGEPKHQAGKPKRARLGLASVATPRPPESDYVELAHDIKFTIDMLVLQAEDGSEDVRSRAIKRLKEHFGSVVGVHPHRRTRRALMHRIDCLARREPIRSGSPEAIALMLARGYSPRHCVDGRTVDISDSDLKPIANVWLDERGAKKAGTGKRSKWTALAKVLEERLGDTTSPKTLQREWLKHQELFELNSGWLV